MKVSSILRKIFLLLFISGSVTAQQSTLQDGLALKYLVQLPAQSATHTPVLILLHGYGSDERDLFELKNSLPKRFLIISARAPYALPNGGYEWYESTDASGQHDGNPQQLANSRNLITKFIGQVIEKYKADPAQVYVAGFSQGAIMSYQVGLTAPGRVAGIGVLSGTIYPSLKPLIKNNAALKMLKIFVAHGTADNRIPFTEGKAAADYLQSLGLKPQFHQYPGMGHTISKDVLNDFVQWLK
jgi:phospholipase/carboxylesterase